MRTITCRRPDLEGRVRELTEGLANPLFRALGDGAEDEFRRDGTLNPKHGSLGAGTGVFFTTSIEYAKGFLKRTLLITTREMIDHQQKAVDTRQEGYDKEARTRMDKKYGPGKYDGYMLWDEITSYDTITFEGGPEGAAVYCRRTPVTQDEILAKIEIEACA